jgi:predicted acyl esterase
MSAVLLLVALLSVIGAANAFTCLLAVNITMRDGIELYTCLDFPLNTNATKFDLVMDRSPYGSGKTEMIADIYLLENYVAVRQDQRGTFDSGGHFTMFVILLDTIMLIFLLCSTSHLITLCDPQVGQRRQ